MAEEMKNKNISSKELEKDIIEEINAKNIKPAAKWKFVFKNWMFWFLAVFSVVLGALAFSSILYFFQPGETEILSHSGAGWREFLLFSLPHFWLIFLLLFFAAAWYYFRHTDKGYRYSLPVTITVSVLSAVLFGSMLYGAGIAGFIDDFLGRQAPFYEKIINPKVGFWLDPEHGRLGGVVIKRESDKEFIIYNRELGEWKIEAPSSISYKACEGCSVVVFGKKISKNIFKAEEIFLPPSGEGFLRRGDPLPPSETKDKIFIQFHSY